jgi:hypothetical protein
MGAARLNLLDEINLMVQRKVTESELRDAYARHNGSTSKIAAEFDVHRRTVANRLRALGFPALQRGESILTKTEQPTEFRIADLPDDDIPVDDLVEHRIKQFAKKRESHDATKSIAVTVSLPGPIAILHFGDPHVDDDGTDLELLRKHSDLTKLPGVWGANVGDTTNNWVGRLAKLYAEQSTSASQAWKLAEWFISRTRWLYMLGGNHDAWSGAGDPIRFIARQSKALYQPSAARLELRFPNQRRVIVNARHDFAGHSMYNPAHSQMRSLQFGARDHLAVSGHRHVSGYGVIKDAETGRVCHALQVASYKVFDRYAMEKGFRDQRLGPAAMTVIDPRLPETHPDMIKIWWDPQEGADYLAMIRSSRPVD